MGGNWGKTYLGSSCYLLCGLSISFLAFLWLWRIGWLCTCGMCITFFALLWCWFWGFWSFLGRCFSALGTRSWLLLSILLWLHSTGSWSTFRLWCLGALGIGLLSFTLCVLILVISLLLTTTGMTFHWRQWSLIAQCSHWSQHSLIKHLSIFNDI